MERAINISSVRNIDEIDLLVKTGLPLIDRFYLGAEFCERLLPSIKDAERLVNKIKLKGKSISLLTPPSTEVGLKKIKLIMRLLEEKDEVIINDYGILNMINHEFENPIVIGRILGRNILLTLNSIGQDLNKIREFLSILSPRVKIIETDYFNGNCVNEFLAKIIDFSFYEGPFFWTMTRRCAFNMNVGELNKFAECNKECLENRAIIKNTAVNKNFLLEGNTIINKDKTIESKVDYSLFNRIIYNLSKGN